MKRVLGKFNIRFSSDRMQRNGPYLLSGLICLLVVALYLSNFSGLTSLELGIQDMMVSAGRHPDPSPDVAVITVDDEAVRKLGRWPWDPERVGYLVGMLSEYQPRAIGLDFEIASDDAGDPVKSQFLADMIAKAGNVVLPLRFTLGNPGTTGQTTPDYVLKSSFVTVDDAVSLMERPFPQAHHVAPPYEAACKAAWGLGQINTWQDLDGKVRRDPLAVRFEGEYYPSMALQLARCALKLNRTQVKIDPNRGIMMGSSVVPCDDAGLLSIDYRGPAGTTRSISASKVLEGQADKNEIAGKVVIVGVTASGYGTSLNTPASPAMPRAEKIATVTANILDGRYITTVTLSTVLDLLILAAVAAFCGVVLPRVVLTYRIVILLVMVFVFADLNFILYSSFKLITKTLYPSLEILLFLLFSPVMKSSAAEPSRTTPARSKIKPTSTPAVSGDRMMGKAGPSPRRARAAVDGDGVPVRVVPADGPAGVIGGLERTMGIETGTASGDPAAADRESREAGSRTAEISPVTAERPAGPYESTRELMDASPIPLGAELDSSNPPGDPGSVRDESVTLRRLGRYEILGVLGQGAMGTVYKGKDHAIDRLVALKTIRAGYGGTPAEAEELRERLVREAKAAGKLSHPNIVTIYDVGADGDLRYIAMEYLEGYTLEQVVRKKVQLNYRIAARILTQVCAALDYAHKAGIVHRDIKPANIMVLEGFKIKVTDFGIARFESPQMSMTQTGIALGTPHYISPEQLRGGPIDRRCDVFSLGVVAYELLTHKRPFAGDNISALIYSITQTNPPLPSTVDQNIPGIFDVVIGKALAKEPRERYQSADEMANDLRVFAEELTAKPYVI
jgi:serine/threonine-protein kinase